MDWPHSKNVIKFTEGVVGTGCFMFSMLLFYDSFLKEGLGAFEELLNICTILKF